MPREKYSNAKILIAFSIHHFPMRLYHISRARNDIFLFGWVTVQEKQF